MQNKATIADVSEVSYRKIHHNIYIITLVKRRSGAVVEKMIPLYMTLLHCIGIGRAVHEREGNASHVGSPRARGTTYKACILHRSEIRRGQQLRTLGLGRPRDTGNDNNSS